MWRIVITYSFLVGMETDSGIIENIMKVSQVKNRATIICCHNLISRYASKRSKIVCKLMSKTPIFISVLVTKDKAWECPKFP